MKLYEDLNDYELMYLVEENDEQAENMLIEKYRPIVINIAKSVAKEAKKFGLELDDLVQEGLFGLYLAIHHYDIHNNTLFYTFAIISIRSKIFNCLRMGRCQKHKVLNNSISIYDSVCNQEDWVLLDTLSDENAMMPHLLVENFDFDKITKNFLYSLEPPVSLVFELMINGFRLKEIMQLLDLSSNRVQYCFQKIRKQLKAYLQKESLI